jgi:hypothetical protein
MIHGHLPDVEHTLRLEESLKSFERELADNPE